MDKKSVINEICTPCNGGDTQEAINCNTDRCFISLFRKNKLKDFETAVRRECKRCFGDNIEEAKHCSDTYCHLYKFNKRVFR